MSMSLLDSPQVIRSVFDATNQALRVSGGFELQGFSYARVHTNTTTLVKSGPGVFSSITINTAGALSNVATIYDGTDNTGVVIAVVDTNSLRSINYTVSFTTGLCIVTATGTAADITVAYA